MHSPLKAIIDRGNDPTGFGHFGAKRGDNKHKGHDIISVPGESVVSMINGTVTKIGYPYGGRAASHLRYVEVTEGEYRIRLMYLEPTALITEGDYVCAGDRVGYASDIAKYHNKGKKKGQALMLNHLHIEIYKNGKLIDPNIYLKEMKS